MGCITNSERIRLTARLKKIESVISNLEDAMLNFNNVQGYTFDSGEGKQATTYRSVAEIEKSLSRLEASADLIRRKLDGRSNPAMNLRRKSGNYHGGSCGY